MIYFDSAATSLQKPPAVARAVVKAMESFGGAGRGSHSPALEASRCIFRARKAIAELLGSVPERTVFTSNATESLNMSINGVLGPGDHAITTALEHNSVLRPLYRLEEQGMELSIVDIDAEGALIYEGFEKQLQSNTRAVVCSYASNLTGYVPDMEYISGFCHEHGLLLIVDASQAAAAFPIDMKAMGIDILCFTGHKGLMGPQGTGGLCLAEGISVRPLTVGGSGMHSFSRTQPEELPEALEAGTLNSHGIAGLLAGVEYIMETGLENIRAKELALTNQFLKAVTALPGLRLYRKATGEYAPIAAFNIGAIPSSEIGDVLAEEYDICVRTGAHCAPLAHIALGTRDQGALRFSFSHFNTESEVQKGIEAITEIALSYAR